MAKSSAAVATTTSSPKAAGVAREEEDAAAVEAEWGDLPPLRRNISCKFREVLLLSRPSLLKEGYSGEALSPLCLSRASEMETALAKAFPNDRKGYTDKARSLSFNLKRNQDLRGAVLLGRTGAAALIHMSSEDLAPADKAKERREQVKDLQDSRRLDWEQANEDKINEMCGIHGDLLQASLFTCGRCKSIKTTSTQKQTRSADEPMTVFVFCMNCGNRWKC
jgi:transcription elongation factor S-II